jgi:2'-hydroxyisoflavone reductase
VNLLVLGGSRFVGRAVVDEGLRRGWTVTTFNRGGGPAEHQGVEWLLGDRLRAGDVAQLSARRWDCVVDTWAGPPRAVRDSAAVLADRAERYVYVSSESVYAHPPPLGGDESSPTVDAAADADEGDYPSLKRGSELAIEAAFGDRAVFARAGTILGPYEDVGRLTWWLLRMDRGGEVLAPSPTELALQYVDVRDLARWLLNAASSQLSGAFNIASRPGHTTTGALLEACRQAAGGRAALTWVDPDHVERSGIQPWSELPIWLPPDDEYRWMLNMNVERAHATGLRCRPLEDTVSDTWEWLLSIDKQPPLRQGASPPGVDDAKERAALATWAARR